MSNAVRAFLTFAAMTALLAVVGIYQSWNVALTILNLCLISAVMSLGVNIQWGYAGLFNAGVMAFTAIGGLAAVLISVSPVGEAWAAGGSNMAITAALLFATTVFAVFVYRTLRPGPMRHLLIAAIIIAGLFLLRGFYLPAVQAIESVNPAKTGFLGGLGLPILFSWLVGGLLAASVALVIGKIALGLRADYLAIATLGISEIVIAVLKNEDWLARGVKNVSGLSRPVPYEYQLQNSEWFISLIERLGAGQLAGLSDAARGAALRQMIIEGSSLFVKLCYTGLFLITLLLILWLCERALHSPWGRMMRAIRDNEEAASAMGKNVTGRHLQVFVLGCTVLGIAGAMLTTLDGQFTPASYQPLRFTFLIWVMVIVGGSGNNLGSVIGGFLIWFVWIEAEPASLHVMQYITAGLGDSNAFKQHLIDSAPHLRLFIMGLVLLLVLRFAPRGLLPERTGRT